MGWRDERIIRQSIERLHQLKVNRLRVLLAGSINNFIGEPIMTDENFTVMLRPWVAEAPQSYERPRIDYTRFNVAYWQKWERMLRFARDRDMVISAILFISTDGDPVQKADGRQRGRAAIHSLRGRAPRARSRTSTGTSATISTASAMRNGPTRRARS